MTNSIPETENPEQIPDAIDDSLSSDCISTNHSDTSTSDPQLDPARFAGLLRRKACLRQDPNASNSETSRFRTNVDDKNEESTITSVNDDEQVGDSVESAHRVGDSVEPEHRAGDSVESTHRDGDRHVESINGSSSFLVFFADLVIKAIGFQFLMFSGLFSVPFSVLYYCYVLCLDPFGVFTYFVKFCKGELCKWWDVASGRVGWTVHNLVAGKYSIGQLALRCGLGVFWSVYVLVMLGGLFMVSLLFGSFVMRFLMEEPVQVKEVLNFDYTKNSPVAYVPVVSCAGFGGDGSCKEKTEFGKIMAPRIIPHNHKAQVTVSLMLPESDYNRNLGIFQIWVDFLSPCGRILANSSHPAMLQFKSEPIRLVSAFLQAVPLISGYASESQTLKVKFKGYTEGDVPTSCLKVTLQQRAEFHPGAGIPEIYDASVVVESELPMLRRLMWSWRKTVFVWISMTSFMMELIFTLICCRPIIVPGMRPRNGFTGTTMI